MYIHIVDTLDKINLGLVAEILSIIDIKVYLKFVLKQKTQKCANEKQPISSFV